MVLIRAAESKDIPALKTLFLQLGYQTETAILAQRITEPQSMMHTLVAEAENTVCGVVVINFILPVHENRLWALISALVIEESSRGSGIGHSFSMPQSASPAINNALILSFQAVKTEPERINFMKLTAIRKSANASLNVCLSRQEVFKRSDCGA